MEAILEAIWKEVIIGNVDVALIGALIWLFNYLFIKDSRSKIPNNYIPWISLGLGVIAALITIIGKGSASTLLSPEGVFEFVKTAMSYGIAAILIQVYGKKGIIDLAMASKGNKES